MRPGPGQVPPFLFCFSKGEVQVLVAQWLNLTSPSEVFLSNLSLTPRPVYNFPFTDAPA